MTFNSVPYLVLLVVVVLLFWLLPARFRRLLVLLGSTAFYASWGLLFIWLPLLVAGIVYLAGRRITADPTHKKGWARVGVACVLTLLVFFKYRVFFLANLHILGIALWSNSLSLPASIAFPVGISFYTFEAIAYLVDLRQGRVKMPRFVDLCLFFFFGRTFCPVRLFARGNLCPSFGFRKRLSRDFVLKGWIA